MEALYTFATKTDMNGTGSNGVVSTKPPLPAATGAVAPIVEVVTSLVKNSCFSLCKEEYTILKAVLVIIGVVGLVGNLIVIVTIVSHSKMLKQVTNVLIVNQSCIDLLAALLLVLVHTIPVKPSLDKGLIIDRLSCRLWNSQLFLWALMFASTGGIVIISVERYIAVLHPIVHKIHVSKRRVLVVSIALNWIICVGYYIALVLPSTDIVDRKCRPLGVWSSPLSAQAVSVITMFVQYLIPVLTMAFCYCRMAYVISQKMVSGAGAATGNPGSYDAMKTNILKAMVSVCCTFVVCYTTNQIFLLLRLIGAPVKFNSWFYKVSVVLVFCSCAVNPIIYAAKYKEFQHGFRHLVGHFGLTFGRSAPLIPVPAIPMHMKTSSTVNTN